MVSRLFWFKFHPQDWLQDTRRLTPAARGIWIDCLCRLWPTGTKTLSEAEWIRELSVTPQEFSAALTELNHGKTADVTLRNNDVTISSRRMLRDATIREQTRTRVKRFRETVEKRNCNSIELEVRVRDQKEEEKKEKMKRRGSVFPDGFAFEPKHEAIAKGFGLNVHAEFAAFRDHHLAKGTVFKDWHAAFRTWLRNAVKFKQRRTS